MNSTRSELLEVRVSDGKHLYRHRVTATASSGSIQYLPGGRWVLLWRHSRGAGFALGDLASGNTVTPAKPRPAPTPVYLALSPDGKKVVLGADKEIWLWRLDEKKDR